MSDSLLKTIFPEIDSLHMKKINNFNKDLFTKKLGHKVTINFSIAKDNNHSFKTPKFLDMLNKFPKNKTNRFISLNKVDNASKIFDLRKKSFLNKTKDIFDNENNKQFINTQFSSSFQNLKNKKEIKKWLDEKSKRNIINNKNTFEKLSDSKTINFIKTEKGTNKSRGFFQYRKLLVNKKLSFQNLRIRNKSDNNLDNIMRRILNEKKKSEIFIKSFFESFIEIENIYDNYNKYIPIVNKFNETYFFLFEIEVFPTNPMNINFLNIYKFFPILIACLIFLSKDKDLYSESISEMKKLLQKFIYLSIISIDYKSLKSPKINDFISIYQSSYKLQTLAFITILNEIINCLFSKKKDDYKKLRKCLKQLLNNIESQTSKQVLSIVNNTILFCHNCGYFQEEKNPKNKRHKKRIKTEDNISNKSDNVNAPFIKKKMAKKFCLVIDLDETLIHNIILPFGNYFFVRPGVFELMEKIRDNYEIIIFTAGKKNYAYNIIDKIDYKNYVDYILYKKHIIYEEGNSVKKLDLIGRDLNKIIYVDNLEKNAKYNKKNLYLIPSWYNNIFDNELFKLKDKLIKIAECGKYDDDITQGLIEA